jgi:hemoglobin
VEQHGHSIDTATPPGKAGTVQGSSVGETVYDAIGGAEGVLRLARAWHERVLSDPVVSHAFSHGFRDDHDERLAAYWGEQLGGPPRFTGAMGDHSGVLRMHSGNGRHDEMNRRAEACFAHALDDAGIPETPELRRTLVSWFHWAVELMDSHPDTPDTVPDGLPIPVWTWDGPDA